VDAARGSHPIHLLARPDNNNNNNNNNNNSNSNDRDEARGRFVLSQHRDFFNYRCSTTDLTRASADKAHLESRISIRSNPNRSHLDSSSSPSFHRFSRKRAQQRERERERMCMRVRARVVRRERSMCVAGARVWRDRRGTVGGRKGKDASDVSSASNEERALYVAIIETMSVIIRIERQYKQSPLRNDLKASGVCAYRAHTPARKRGCGTRTCAREFHFPRSFDRLRAPSPSRRGALASEFPCSGEFRGNRECASHRT